MKKALFLLTILSPLFASAQYHPLSPAVPFLLISPDARSAAMGNAGAATTPDANSIYWNLSKLAFADSASFGVSASYTPWHRALVSDQNLWNLSAYTLVGKNAFSGSVRYFTPNPYLVSRGSSSVIRDYSPEEFAIDAGWARKLNSKFSIGLSGRYIVSTSYSGLAWNMNEIKSRKAYAMDLSSYYQDEGRILGKPVTYSLGMNLSNIGTRIVYNFYDVKELLPANLRLGGAVRVRANESNHFLFTADLNKLLIPSYPTPWGVPYTGTHLNSFTDAQGGFREELSEVTRGGGMEYSYKDWLKLRGGYYFDHPEKGNVQYFSAGAGFAYKRLTLDASYIRPTRRRNPEENTWRVSLTYTVKRKSKSVSSLQ